MEMTSLLSFTINDSYIQTPKGTFYFFRVIPPNFSTLDESDKAKLFLQFEDFMRLTADIPFRVFVCDKTVNLSGNRQYIQGISAFFGEIKRALLDDLDTFEKKRGNTERAFYFVLQAKKPEVCDQFQGMLRAAQINHELCRITELAAVMRCFLLREFVDERIFLAGGEDPDELRSQLVRHLLPSYLQINENNIIQPNFIRCAFVIRNLPQNITAGNRHLLQELMLTPGTTMNMHVSSMSGAKVKELVDKQLNNKFAGLFKKRDTDRLEAQGDYDNLQKFYQDCLKDSGRGGAVKHMNLFLEVSDSVHKEATTEH